jgi:hypothetical protein
MAGQILVVKNVANYLREGHFYVSYEDAGNILLTDRKIKECGN